MQVQIRPGQPARNLFPNGFPARGGAEQTASAEMRSRQADRIRDSRTIT